MVQAYTAFRDSVEATLQDTTNVNFSTAELDVCIAQACREAGRYVPHVVKVSFNIESRFGTATSTSSNNLVDTKSQFLAGDVGKVVYNTTDKTWALIKTYTSSSSVVLSKDIMASGDTYEIYNSGCTQSNQISLSNIDDYLDVERVEYPIGTPRNWEIQGNVLTLKIDYIPDSMVVTGVQPDTEVIVWFKKRHLISQLTDLAGAVNNAPGYSAGDTSMAINGLQSSGTIEQGQEFTLANVRGTYTVTADATISGNAATISFYPPLESTVANSIVITFTSSTLTPTLEPLVIELAAALAVISECMTLYQQTEAAITAVGLTTVAVAAVAALTAQAGTDLAAGRVEAAKISAILDTANTEIDKIAARLTQVGTDIGAGRTEADKVPTIVSAAGTTISAVAARVTAAVNDITSARTAIALGVTAIVAANTEMGLTDAQVDLAVTALNAGNSLINTVTVGGGASEYMGQASGDVGAAQGFVMSGQGFLQTASADFSNANTDINAAAREVDAGLAKVREAQASLEQANTDMAANRTYIDQASAQLRLAQGYFQEAQGYVMECNTRMADNAAYLGLANGQLNAARAKIQEGQASLTKANSQITIARAGQTLEGYGRNQLREVRLKLSNLVPNKYRTSHVYSRN